MTGMIKIHTDYVPINDDLSIIIKYKERHTDKTYFITMALKERQPNDAYWDKSNCFIGGSINDPVLGSQFLRAMLNHAWELGYRPDGFNDVPLQVAALKEHRDDMRKLVFNLLDIDK